MCGGEGDGIGEGEMDCVEVVVGEGEGGVVGEVGVEGGGD